MSLDYLLHEFDVLLQLLVHDFPAVRLAILLVGEFATVPFVDHVQLCFEVVHLGASRLPGRQEYWDGIKNKLK